MNAEDALTVSPSFAAAARRGSMSSQKPGCTLVPAPVASDVCNVRRRTGGMDTAGVRAVRAVRLQGVGPALWVACQGRPQRQPTASFCAFRAGSPARVAGVGP